MRLLYLATLIAVFLAGDLFAAPTAAPVKTEQDLWDTVFARDRNGNDQQIGYSHLRIEPVTVDDKKLIRASLELRLTIKRDGQLAQLRSDTGTDETAEGKVVGAFMKQWIGQTQALTMRGVVDETGKKIKLKVESDMKREFDNDWNPKVMGLSSESTLLRDKKIVPGDSFSYLHFEPTLSSVVTIKVEVKKIEEVLLPRGGKKQLLRVEEKSEKIQDVQLPALIMWVDPQTLDTVMTQSEMPGFGLLTLQRSTKEVATGPLGAVPDLMKMQMIKLDQRISGDRYAIHGLKSVTYKVTVDGDADLTKLLKASDRQKITKLDGKSFELTVEAIRSPRHLDKEVPATEEFLQSNHFLNSDDKLVRQRAAEAVGKLTDPWEKAKAIEHWVRANMKAEDYTEAMATSDHVAKTLKGDCSEYSMLAAAMCKAEGIPARTAMGIVYVDKGENKGAEFGFHMWTEVYVKGQWLGLDATLGRGGVGPGHIKITDHSWHDVESFKPLLPVTGFMLAKPKIEIKSATKE